jgi:hypothetical protein
MRQVLPAFPKPPLRPSQGRFGVEPTGCHPARCEPKPLWMAPDKLAIKPSGSLDGNLCLERQVGTDREGNALLACGILKPAEFDDAAGPRST